MSGSGGGGIGRREVAVRCFAAEYDDASLEYSESDEERAPNYVVTPTGARVNRLFVVGVLTEVEPVSDDVLRARVVDPTGAFVVYAGQYQPDAKTFLERAEPPQFVAVTGKARTFEPDDADTVYTSVRPESINAVDPETRDRWTVQTAEFTLDRVATFAAALEREEREGALQEALVSGGVDPALAAGIPRAIDHYGTSEAYLAAVRQMALQAAEVVAGEREEVDPLELSPGEGGATDVDLAAEVDVEAAAGPSTNTSMEASAAASGRDDSSAGAVETTADAGSSEPEAGAESEVGAGAEAEAESETPSAAEPGDTTATAGTAPASAEGEPSTEGAGGTDGDGDLGDFDDFGADEGVAEEPAGETDTAGTDTAGTDTAEASGGATDEMYEMDDDEREAIEEEFGTEFSTGSEVEEAGEADIETPGPVDGDGDDASGTAAPAEGSTRDETENVSSAAPAAPEDEAAAPGDEAGVETARAEGQTDAGEEDTAGEEDANAGGDEVDLQDAVVDAMAALDEGDGADRQAVVEEVVDEHGVDREAVEDAIQDALMGGRCYEPEDGRLKAI